ncbi:DNA polymerase IV [Pontibacter sp. G13]|uniref:DNA polymerase IV n=1 Tax=Pontibacter sp. G13 TaxID=3074898 RepID=UPI00288B6281|nr:DNA polymerase IV [Pontibacter sp. G13]WNJ17608.1 DNA polymerase IV [Pontibacter sp. G13]
MAQRKIIHVDMDAFYASIEQRDHPEWRGKPLAVGGSRERGVVAAASYEARKFGVRSAMPSVTAIRLCPEIIFAKARFEVYREVSYQIREIFFSYTDLVEPLSLDEAFLDVTENKRGMESATQIARQIRAEIFEETHLTASAGISINKFLAKVASDIHKPNGVTLIPPDRIEPFLEDLPIDKFFGIGKKTADKMKRLGIRNGADLKKRSELELAQRFGKAGRYYYRIVRGLDDRPVKPDRIAKSVGAENTFSQDIQSEAEMVEALSPLAEKVSRRLTTRHTSGKTVTLKIKYHDFTQTTRSHTGKRFIQTAPDILAEARSLLHQPHFPDRPVRLLGVSVSNLDNQPNPYGIQLTLDF